MAIVFEKNCQAANLALKKAIPPVQKVSAQVERIVYLRKYSKLKDPAGDSRDLPEGDGSC